MDEKIVQKFLMLFTLMACWHTDSNPPCDSFPTVTTCQWSCEKVMFSVLSVCSHGGWGLMWLLPMMLWTSLYRVPSALAEIHSPYMGTLPWWGRLVTITGDLFKLVHFRTPHLQRYWQLELIEVASGRYASYLNAFLFCRLVTLTTSPVKIWKRHPTTFHKTYQYNQLNNWPESKLQDPDWSSEPEEPVSWWVLRSDVVLDAVFSQQQKSQDGRSQ